MRPRQKPWIVTVALCMAALIALLPATEAANYNLTYDANGNLITGDGKYRVYDSFNHLFRLYNGSDTNGTLLQEYVYHPTEDRILLKRTYNTSGSVTETVTYVSDDYVQITNASGTYNTTYISTGDQQVAQILPDGTTQYLLTDAEGSVVVTTNASGAVLERTSYTPYGGVLTGGTNTRFDYEGREADSLAGDTDFRFRKYKPTWGLFTQPDDTIASLYDPQALNRYAFERNNPAKYTDTTGHCIEDLCVAETVLYITLAYVLPWAVDNSGMLIRGAIIEKWVPTPLAWRDPTPPPKQQGYTPYGSIGPAQTSCTQSCNANYVERKALSTPATATLVPATKTETSTKASLQSTAPVARRPAVLKSAAGRRVSQDMLPFLRGSGTIDKDAYVAATIAEAEQKYAWYKEAGEWDKYRHHVDMAAEKARNQARKVNGER